MNTQVTYKDNKHPYFEEKVVQVAAEYHGKSVQDSFEHDYNGFSIIVGFKTAEQEKAFRAEISRIAAIMNVSVSFSGIYGI